MGTLLKYFVSGIALIGAINTALYFLLQRIALEPTVSFFILALVSLSSLFILGCVLHLRLLAAKEQGLQRKESRADVGDVVLLQQTEQAKVSRIPIEKQSQARENRSAKVFTTRPMSDFISESEAEPKPKPRPPKKLPMPNPPTPEVVLPTPFREEPRAENLSIPDLMQEIHAEGRSISELVKRYRIQLRDLEARSIGEGLDERIVPIPEMSDAGRILTALEARLDRLRDSIGTHDAKSLLKARDALNETLVLPRDAVHAIIQTQELPALARSEWKPTLERLLDAIVSEISSQEEPLKIQNV